MLAAIHYQMDGKIRWQDQINQEISEKFLNRPIRGLDKRPLEEIIDGTNIHGFLAQRIQEVEETLAQLVEEIADKGQFEDLLVFMEDKGRNENLEAKPQAVFAHMTNHYLDGMPCDRVVELVSQEEDAWTWILREDVHGQYWQDPTKYWALREAYLQGLAQAASCGVQIQGRKYEVKKCMQSND